MKILNNYYKALFFLLYFIYNKMTDNIYYNIGIHNRDRTNLRAIYNETRVNNVLTHPNDYQVTVPRFKLDTFGIPIAFYQSNWEVTLDFQGNFYPTVVPFISNTTTDPYNQQSLESHYQIADMINAALLSSFNAMKAAFPGSPQTIQPFIIFDSATNLYTLRAEQTYSLATSGANECKVFFNDALGELFAFQSIVIPANIGKEFQILIKNNLNNFSTYLAQAMYDMVGEFVTADLASEISSLKMYTSLIPIVPQLQGEQNPVLEHVLFDFEFVREQTGLNRKTIIYSPQGPYAWQNLNSNHELRSIDIELKFVTYSGVEYPIFFETGQEFSIKLLFQKKPTLQVEDAIEEKSN